MCGFTDLLLFKRETIQLKTKDSVNIQPQTFTAVINKIPDIEVSSWQSNTADLYTKATFSLKKQVKKMLFKLEQ